MGEGAVRKAPAVMASVGLGSCVVLMLYDPGPRIGGLAHILLPSSPVRSAGGYGQQCRQNLIPGNSVYLYADTALRALFKEMTVLGASLGTLYARIAGGAKMFTDADQSGNGMGVRNILSIKRLLTREKIVLIGEDTGGCRGRSVDFHLDSGRVLVSTIGGVIREM